MNKLQFGIQMYTLRNYMKTPEEFENTLKRVSEMGYTNVQITPPPFISVQDMAVLLKKYNLKADSAICTVYAIPSRIDEICAVAKVLETQVVRTDSISNEDRRSIQGYERFAEHLNTCGKLLKEKGLKFMYHFHSFEFVKLGDKRGIDILLENTDPEYVMFQPDVFWLTSAGTEPSYSLKMFEGRAEYVHLKDYVIVPADTAVLEETKRASAPVGTGNLNLEKIFETAKAMGIYNFVVEDDMGVLDPFESARQSIENMKKAGFVQ